MSVPYVFANAVGSIPLSELDANFAQVAVYSNTAGTVTASSQPNITALGALSSLSVTGNVAANYFLGNGSQLTGIVANTTYNNSNVAAFLPTYTGNITANNINITGVYTGNGSGLSQITGGNVTGQVANAAIATLAVAANTATVANTVSTAAQPNITSVGNLTSLTVTGNASAGNINTNILTANTLSGTLSTAAQPNITSIGNLTTLTVTGNASGGNILTAGIISATGNIVTDGFFVGTFVGNITGNLTVPGSNTQVIYNNNGNAGASAGFTFDSAANAMAVSGTLSASGNVTGGNLLTSGNVSATYLLGNGSQITSLPIDTYIQNGNSNVVVFANDAVTISANGTSNVAAFRPSSFLPGTYIMQMAGAIFATGNILSNTQVSATGNVTGGNIITGGLVSAIGNINGGNLLTVGLISATGNITGGNLISSGNIATLSNVKRVIHVANTAPTSGDGADGDIWYQTY